VTDRDRQQLVDVALERSYIAALWNDDAPTVRKHLSSPQRLDPLDCSSRQHGQILAAVHELAAAGAEISPLTIRAGFDAQGATAQVSALDEIFAQHDARPDSLGTMAHRLTQLGHLRRVRQNLAQALESCEQQNLEGALEHARDAVGEEPRGQVKVEALHASAIAAVDGARKAEQGVGQVVPTGFPLLDNTLRGFMAASLTIIGGRTGAGKSSLMLSMALKQARMGVQAGIVSLEDPRTLWGARAIAHVSGIPSDELLAQQLSFDSERELERALCELQHIGVQLVYALNRPLGDVLTAIRALVNAGCGIVYVDYLQAIMLGHEAKRAELVSEAAQRLKSECQALNVPLVLGSQLTRAEKHSRFAEPFESELKESGDLENKAEAVCLLWKSSDGEDAQAFGKFSKIKHTPKRPRFEVIRNGTGAVTNLGPFTSQQHSNGNEQPTRQPW
jgi:replicative DNA helicase